MLASPYHVALEAPEKPGVVVGAVWDVDVFYAYAEDLNAMYICSTCDDVIDILIQCTGHYGGDHCRQRMRHAFMVQELRQLD